MYAPLLKAEKKEEQDRLVKAYSHKAKNMNDIERYHCNKLSNALHAAIKLYEIKNFEIFFKFLNNKFYRKHTASNKDIHCYTYADKNNMNKFRIIVIDITTGRNIIYSQINSNTYRYYSLSEGIFGDIQGIPINVIENFSGELEGIPINVKNKGMSGKIQGTPINGTNKN